MNSLKKILNVSQIREAEKDAIQRNFDSSLALMENAAVSFVEALEKQGIDSKKIIIVCGTGNNGGDGFAICRILKEKGFDARCVLVKFSETLSKDCQTNKNRLDDVTVLDETTPIPDFSQYDIIIDAIFGSGLNKPIIGFTANIVEAINNAGRKVYSVDIPSGLMCETISISKKIVKATHVISFQRPKLSFFFPESSPYMKHWEVVNIGLNESFLQKQDASNYLLDENILDNVKPRERQSHKGTYGHALLMAGSYGKIGAAVLSTRACLRSGVGLLTTKVPKCGYEIIQTTAPEAMCLTDENTEILTKLPSDLTKYDAIGFGPGIGKHDLTAELMKNLLREKLPPLVLDADAINILSQRKEFLALLPKNTILTPHIKEFDRLVGPSQNSEERFKKQREFSQKNTCIIVLKNAHTSISSPNGNLFFNTSGNQGMATGGSGDVLTGIITGLLAQKYDPLFAALIGVYFHGKAGDNALKEKCFNSMIASDIIESLAIKR